MVLEQELVGLAASAGVDGVLCVTGDGRGRPACGPEVTQVFDIDGTRLAALAAAAGLVVAVPEAPSTRRRPRCGPARLRREAARRRARSACSTTRAQPSRVAAFVAAAGAAGVTLPLIAGVAVYTDERSAAGAAALPRACTSIPGRSAGVLRAPDPVRRGDRRGGGRGARACSRCPGSSASTCPGWAPTAASCSAADVKATIGREIGAGVAA